MKIHTLIAALALAAGGTAFAQTPAVPAPAASKAPVVEAAPAKTAPAVEATSEKAKHPAHSATSAEHAKTSSAEHAKTEHAKTKKAPAKAQ